MNLKSIENNEEYVMRFNITLFIKLILIYIRKSSANSSEYEDIFDNIDEGSISSEDSHSKKVSGPGLLFLFNQESQNQKNESK